MIEHPDGNYQEKLNARARLYAILDKNGMSIKDLERESEKKKCKFKYVYADEKQIIVQVVSALTNNPKMPYSWYKDKKKEIFIELYDWQYTEAIAMVDFHLSQYRKDKKTKLKTLTSAYIHKHKLYPESNEAKEDKGESSLTRKEIMDILNTADSMDDIYYHKQLD
jgi:hypothetical protein